MVVLYLIDFFEEIHFILCRGVPIHGTKDQGCSFSRFNELQKWDDKTRHLTKNLDLITI